MSASAVVRKLGFITTCVSFLQLHSCLCYNNIARLTAKTGQDGSSNMILMTPDYLNNFVFEKNKTKIRPPVMSLIQSCTVRSEQAVDLDQEISQFG